MRRKHVFRAVLVMTALAMLATLPAGVGAERAWSDGEDFGFYAPSDLPPEALESVLYRAEQVFLERGLPHARRFAEATGVGVRAGAVEVEVFPSGDSAASYEAVVALGGRVKYGGPDFPVTVALMPLGTLQDLAADPAVRWVQAPPEPFPEAAVTGEGIAASGADAWHTKGYQGQGVQVAVLDSGFTGLAAAQANGDLPASLTTKSFCSAGIGGSTSHGTGVAEIVHEMAPLADLYLICSDSSADINLALNYMNTKGIDVFNHSVGYFNTQRGDGTGLFYDLATKAKRLDVLWVNSAGNYAANHWSGNMADSGLGGDPDGILNFVPTDEGNTFSLANNQGVNVILRWDDWPTSNKDFDLYLYQHNLGFVTPVNWSTNLQTGTQTPTENFYHVNTTGSSQVYHLVVQHKGGAPAPVVDFDLFILSPNDMQYVVGDRSLNDPSTVDRILAAAAVNHADDMYEYYSSRGPTIDGRIRPDLSGYARVSNYTYGTFYGTSAAAPHVTGAAALARQAWPDFSAGQIKIKLLSRAVDAGIGGRDNFYGEGLLDLGTPPPLPRCDGKVPTIWGSGDDDVITGTSGNDVIVGLGGTDQIDGLGGHDRICGGPGDDIIEGGAGNDRIFGDEGNDFLAGDGGDDKAWGGEGNDQIDGGNGSDFVYGEAGNDYFVAGTGGSDYYNGGTGGDQIDYSLAPNGVIIDLEGGTAVDRAINDIITRVENAVGSQYDDVIKGNTRPNKLIGQGGNDIIRGGDAKDKIYGSAGNDILKGENGPDRMWGEAGNDVLYGGADTDFLHGGGGTGDECYQGESHKACEIF